MILENNPAITMKSLAIAVQSTGVQIHGKYAGTSLGAALSHRPDWTCVNRTKGFWRMTDVGFTAAQAKHYSTTSTAPTPQTDADSVVAAH